jgi:competence CoiA-like predicted nuclease
MTVVKIKRTDDGEKTNNKMNRNYCPKCKGISGYIVKILVKAKENRKWNNEYIDRLMDDEVISFSKIVVCQDCGYKLRLKNGVK